VDSPITILQEPSGKFVFADMGSGGPVAADSFYREIAPDGMLLNESPPGCTSLTPPPPSSVAPPHWTWAQGNDIHEVLLPGADGVPGTVLHLGKVLKDPFFDAGLAAQGARLQLGTTMTCSGSQVLAFLKCMISLLLNYLRTKGLPLISIVECSHLVA